MGWLPSNPLSVGRVYGMIRSCYHSAQGRTVYGGYYYWDGSGKTHFPAPWRNWIWRAPFPQKADAGSISGFHVASLAEIIVFEACGSSSYWAREMQSLGHEVRLIAPQYVKACMRRLRPIEFCLARFGDVMERRAASSSSGTTRRGPYEGLSACAGYAHGIRASVSRARWPLASFVNSSLR